MKNLGLIGKNSEGTSGLHLILNCANKFFPFLKRNFLNGKMAREKLIFVLGRPSTDQYLLSKPDAVRREKNHHSQ